CVFLVLSPLWIGTISFLLNPWDPGFFVTWISQSIFPKGLFFLVLFFTFHAVWKMKKAPSDAMSLQEVSLGIYGCLIALRVMMELRASIWDCTVFFNGPAFLVFIIVLNRIFSLVCKSLSARRRNFVMRSLLGAEVAMLCTLLFPRPQMLPTRLQTKYGSFYTRPDVAVLFPQIISFMRTHTKNGKDIL